MVTSSETEFIDRPTDYSISIIRFAALCMIICCHFTQYYDLEICTWLNVGVQIFLCISGFLYGQRCIDDYSTFIHRRFKKVLIPYYIVFLSYALLQYLFVREKFDLDRFIGGLIVNKRLNGAGHLWFVATILMCYVITVFLDAYQKKVVCTKKRWLLFSGISFVIAIITYRHFLYYYGAAWMFCYTIGYSLGINEKKKYVSIKTIGIVVLVLCLLGNGYQIYCDYIGNVIIPGKYNTQYLHFKSYNHVWLGVSIFLWMKIILDKAKYGNHIAKILRQMDKYSYETYLVHQLIILGPLSMMKITGSLPLNILLILLSSAALAILLKEMERRILLTVDKIKRKSLVKSETTV